MFNFKKIGTAALSLAALGLMIQGPAAFAESTTGDLSGTGQGGVFTPGQDQAGDWNVTTPSANGNLNIEYTITAEDSVHLLDQYWVDMEVPTSTAFLIDIYSAQNNVVKVNSREDNGVAELGTIKNNSYGIVGIEGSEDTAQEYAVDSIVSVVGYNVAQGSAKLRGGFNFSLLGDGSTGSASTVNLVQGQAGQEANDYIQYTAPPQLAIVGGSVRANVDADHVGSQFNVDYTIEMDLGDGTTNTIREQLAQNGNILKETGNLTLRYAFKKGAASVEVPVETPVAP